MKNKSKKKNSKIQIFMQDNSKKIIIILCLILFLVLFYLFINFNKYNTYYVIYKNMNDENYSTKILKTTQKNIIKKLSKYDYVIIDEILDKKVYDNYDFRMLLRNKNYDYDIEINHKIISMDELIAVNAINTNYYNFNYNELNNYLTERKISDAIDYLENIVVLSKKSYFLKDNKLIELVPGPLFKIVPSKTKINNLDEIINNAANRLVKMCKNNGKFDYGYYLLDGSNISSYNALRHAGTIWSLILAYEQFPDNEKKEIIDKAIDYMIKYYVYYNQNNSEIAYIKNNEKLNIGGNGLALLVLSEYQKAFDSDKYYEVARKLADGILASQKESGQILHKYNKNFELEKEFVISYYDGEATFGLMKFYEITNDEKYFNAVKKAMNYFIDNNYEQYKDHWISYALNEFIRYNHEKKYIEFMVKHYNEKNDNISKFIPARVEAIMSIYDTYDYLSNLNIENETLEKLSRDKLLNSIELNLINLLRFYADEEILVYLKYSDLVSYGFYATNDNNRMRIDDIQHTLGALIHYKQLLDINKIVDSRGIK